MLPNSNQPYSCLLLTAVATVKNYIDENPFQHKSSEELLRHFKIPNRNILVNTFKELHAMGIKQYMVWQRLEHSKQFLESGMDLKTIASKCFYSNHNSYSRAFRVAFNISPTGWLDGHSEV